MDPVVTPSASPERERLAELVAEGERRGWRLVRMSIDPWQGLRTHEGGTLTTEWGEPDADGLWTPVITRHEAAAPREAGSAALLRERLDQLVVSGKLDGVHAGCVRQIAAVLEADPPAGADCERLLDVEAE